MVLVLCVVCVCVCLCGRWGFHGSTIHICCVVFGAGVVGESSLDDIHRDLGHSRCRSVGTQTQNTIGASRWSAQRSPQSGRTRSIRRRDQPDDALKTIIAFSSLVMYCVLTMFCRCCADDKSIQWNFDDECFCKKERRKKKMHLILTIMFEFNYRGSVAKSRHRPRPNGPCWRLKTSYGAAAAAAAATAPVVDAMTVSSCDSSANVSSSNSDFNNSCSCQRHLHFTRCHRRGSRLVRYTNAKTGNGRQLNVLQRVRQFVE